MNLFENYQRSDALERMQRAQRGFLALLTQMPRIDDDDSGEKMKLLLGLPTIDSIHYLVEFGAYVTSNKLFGNASDLVFRLLQHVPWTVLKGILSAPLFTIQAIAESVFNHAIKMGHIQVVIDMLEGLRFKKMIRSSAILLNMAVESSNAELVRSFLDVGGRPDKAWGVRYPMEDARTVQIARMLVDSGADVNAGGSDALFRAVRRDDVDVVRYLIGAGARINRPSDCESPLAVAAEGEKIELVQLLLEHGADPNLGSSSMFESNTVLQLAARTGSLDIVKLLIEAGADVNAPASCPFSETALQAASSQGHEQVVACLLESGADVNAPDNHRSQFPQTAITTAVEMNHLRLIRLLLDAGADVNIPSWRNHKSQFPTTLLMIAVEMNHLELVKSLLDAGAHINTPSFGYYGCTVLEAARSRSTNTGILDLLIAKDAHEVASLPNSYNKIQLRDAVRRGDLSRVQVLMKNDVQIDMQIIEGSPEHGKLGIKNQTILHWALEDSGKKVNRKLLRLEDSGKKLNIKLFRFLVENIHDVNAQNEMPELKPILLSAIQTGHVEIVEILIDAGADINLCWYKEGTPLMFAASRGECEMVRFLTLKGADIYAIVKSELATTALQAALYRGQSLLCHCLLAHGAKINAPIADSGSSELTYAVETNSLNMVRKLLDRGAEVNPAPGWWGTPLQSTAWVVFPNMVMVELLLERGADVNAPSGSHGLTALKYAV